MKNNKGLSQIVTTLVIILLAFVALAVIWMVVSDLLDSNKDDIAISSKCMGLDFKIQKVANTTNGYNVTFYRGTGGEDIGVGLKVVLYGSNGAFSDPVETKDNEMLQYMGSRTVAINITDLGNFLLQSIDYAPYFVDENTQERRYCPVITKEYSQSSVVEN